MPAKILAVAQRKGGAGKTTLAVQLGVAWARMGRRVAMLDVDPQGSMSAWWTARQNAEGKSGSSPAPNPAVAAVQGWKLASEIDRLRNACDIVIIDTPPHADTDARVACRAADLVVVPVQPSPMDLWATGATLELVLKEKGRALLVMNRVPARGRLIGYSQENIAREHLPLASAGLGNRTAFAASMADGRGVVESEPGSPAAQEIAVLAAEIEAKLKG